MWNLARCCFLSAKDYWINKTNVVLDPQRTFSGANHVFLLPRNYLSVEGGGHGPCIVTHDVPWLPWGILVFISMWMITLNLNPQWCTNLFNNMWGTNFPQRIGGDFSFRFTLFG